MASNQFEMLVALGIDDKVSQSNIKTYLEQFKNCKIDVDLNVSGASGTNRQMQELQSIISGLNAEVARLSRDLNNVSKGTNLGGLEKSFESVGKSVNKLSNDIKKDYIQMLDSHEKLQEYLDNLQVRVKVSRNANDEITKYVTQVKNELNQIETVTIKPIMGGAGGFSVSSMVDDASTFKLNDALEQARLKLKEIEIQGALSANKIAEFSARLASADSNTAIDNIVKDMQLLTKEVGSLEKFENAMRKADDAIRDLERGGYASKVAISSLREAMGNIPIGDLSRVKDVMKQIGDEADAVARRESINDFVARSINELGKLDNQIVKTQKLYANSFDRIEAKAATAGIAELEAQLIKLAATASQDINLVTDKDMKTLTENIKQANNQVKEFNANATTAVRSSIGMVEALKTAYTKFPIWMLASTSFYSTIQGVQDLTEKVIELDTALVSLSRVSDADQFELNTAIEESIANVSELSGKTADYLELVNEFARTGQNLSGAMDLADTATVLQNISDLDASQSMDALTASMINFNLSAEESIRVADKLNEVN